MLKKRITRIIAGILSCLFVGIFMSGFIRIVIDNRNKMDNPEISIWEVEDEMNDIYYKLWAIGNMYLRNLDDKGNFKGTEALKEQTVLALRKLGCMDEKGNLSINDEYDYEYLVSYGENSFSNTKKSYDELACEYSLTRKNDGISHYTYYSSWNYTIGDFNAYNTNYGMHYYYLNGTGVALFDYDTEGLNSYVDELGATIYYKTDGSTPLPDDYLGYIHESYINDYDETRYDEYGNEIAVESVPHGTNMVYENGLYIYDDSRGGFIRFEQDKFTKTQLIEMPLTIAIKPSDEFIKVVKDDYEKQEQLQKTAIRSVIENIPLLIIAFILMLFVLIMGGYNANDKKYSMGFIEKIFAEIPIVVIFLSVLFGDCMLDYEEIYQGFTELYNEEMFITAYGFAYFALFGIIILMLNTLIIRIKCHSFWKTTFIWAIMITIYGWIKKLKNIVAEKTINRDMMQNDKFTKRFLIRTTAFVSAEIFFTLASLSFRTYFFMFFISLVLLSGYIVLSMLDLRAMNRISQHITAINSGDYTPRIEPKDSSAYCLTEKLNNISSGIQTAVDRQVRSERMKIDLVTNVSHDLKTPLTSIISYIDLLSTEELSPEAKDYVNIIENKSQRLKSMVADLFDLAKATSHTDIDVEKIDIVILANQVLADLNDKIEVSGKIIRTDIQTETAPVMAEGKKMYRVFQNLIDNALKYSLNGTRIYLNLKNELGYCIISVKNIASYEMNFAPDEIIERFTRGDESRSTEGNGLGLSIAKSFTEACGGTFGITIDGDVFTAEVKLPIIE